MGVEYAFYIALNLLKDLVFAARAMSLTQLGPKLNWVRSVTGPTPDRPGDHRALKHGYAFNLVIYHYSGTNINPKNRIAFYFNFLHYPLESKNMAALWVTVCGSPWWVPLSDLGAT